MSSARVAGRFNALPEATSGVGESMQNVARAMNFHSGGNSSG